MLEAIEQNKQLGELKFGKEYNFYYIITNRYPTPVTIVNLHVGCTSCTTAQIDKSVIAPGDQAKITVRYTPGSTGIALKSIDVAHSVDAEMKPALKLTFKAQVS